MIVPPPGLDLITNRTTDKTDWRHGEQECYDLLKWRNPLRCSRWSKTVKGCGSWSCRQCVWVFGQRTARRASWGLSRAFSQGAGAMSLCLTDPYTPMLHYAEFKKCQAALRKRLRDRGLLADDYLSVLACSIVTGRLHAHVLLAGGPKVSELIYREHAIAAGFGENFTATPVTRSKASIWYLSNYYGSNAVTFGLAHQGTAETWLKPVTCAKLNMYFSSPRR